MLGLFEDFKPKFVKKYANVRDLIKNAVTDYTKEVREGKFPDDAHSFEMTEEETGRLYGRTKPNTD
jgi:3-methyl-2-oxobutanoate hydroxymethyltransferase